MARDVDNSEHIESKSDLVAWLEAGCKPVTKFGVGVEHEKIPFYKSDYAPVPYEGPRGICALLEGVQERLGWSVLQDGEVLIGLYDESGGGAISLEPGGQFELSGAIQSDVHAVAAELGLHLDAVHDVGGQLGIGFLSLGMSPKWTLAETPVMPKSRYGIMTRYMPKVGTRGLDMMYRTATVQTNLDYSSETDMVLKLRVALALQPVLTALFANSPFTDGGLNGLMSARSEVWRNTDSARCGMLPFAFESGMGFERYVDYALDVPMYFVKRGETYHDVAGSNFRDLLAGRLEAVPGERATTSDWANHLSTIFPEVRLKRYLEMRGSDVGPAERIVAQSALMVGIFYDADALEGAWDLVKGWSAEERQALRDEVPARALATSINGRNMVDIAGDVLALARAGLSRRSRRNSNNLDETIHLEPLELIVGDGRAPAQCWIDRFNSSWGGSVDPAFHEAVI